MSPIAAAAGSAVLGILTITACGSPAAPANAPAASASVTAAPASTPAATGPSPSVSYLPASLGTAFFAGVYEYMYNGGCNTNPSWNQGNGLSTGRQCLNYATTPGAQPGTTTVASTWPAWCAYQIQWDGSFPQAQDGCVWAATVYAPAHPGGGTALVNDSGGPYTAPPADSVPPAGHDAGWVFAYNYAYSVWNGQAAQMETDWSAANWCAQIGTDTGPGTVADQTPGCLAGVKAAGGPSS